MNTSYRHLSKNKHDMHDRHLMYQDIHHNSNVRLSHEYYQYLPRVHFLPIYHSGHELHLYSRFDYPVESRAKLS